MRHRDRVKLSAAEDKSKHLLSTDDRHHREPAVGQLGRELFGLFRGVVGGEHLEAEVARSGRSARGLVLGELA
eukprot:11104886-Alexandrium_andersonii.AAC.1